MGRIVVFGAGWLGNLTDPHPSSSGRKAAGLPICTSLE
jgi:hypothetical protein